MSDTTNTSKTFLLDVIDELNRLRRTVATASRERTAIPMRAPHTPLPSLGDTGVNTGYRLDYWSSALESDHPCTVTEESDTDTDCESSDDGYFPQWTMGYADLFRYMQLGCPALDN